MNKTLLSFLLISLSLTAYSQYVYVPMPLTDGQWRYRMTTIFQNSVTINDNLLLGTNSDTIIAGSTYKKILRRDHTTQGQQPFSFPTQSVVGDMPDYTFLPMREDNKRVYMHYGGNDTLVYDFNLTVGDTIPTVFNVVPPTSGFPIYTIIKIDTVNISGSLRQRFTAKSITFLTNDTITVVEGIGSDRGLFMNNIPGNYGLYTLTPEFHCMNAPGIYYSPKNGLCTYVWPYGTPTGVSTISASEGIRMYPNPFLEELQIQTSSPGQLTIFNTTGYMVYQLDVARGHTEIGTANLGAGIYVAVLKGKNGEILQRQLLVKQR